MRNEFAKLYNTKQGCTGCSPSFPFCIPGGSICCLWQRRCRCCCGCRFPAPCQPRPCPPCPPSPAFFTVTFDATGGMPTPPAQTVEYGGLATRPTDPVREGYVFQGWYSTPGFTADAWDFDTDIVTADTVLYARWLSPLFTVIFAAYGGMPAPAYQLVPRGGLVTKPADMEKEEYVFVGWYPTWDFSGSPWNFATDTVTQDMILYARWLQPAG